MSYSLPHFKFQKSFEKQIKAYWTICAAAEFSHLWVDEKGSANTTLTNAFGKRAPFTYLDISVEEFTSELQKMQYAALSNTIVNLVTTFEVYLFEILRHIYYLNPALLQNISGSSSEKAVQVGVDEIAHGLQTNDYKFWISNHITDRLIRNKQHYEIINRIGRTIKRDYSSIREKIDLWSKYVLVRNSIVHANGIVTPDLNEAWASKYPQVGKPLFLTVADLKILQKTAWIISRQIDQQVCISAIKNTDAELLVREAFVRHGIEEPNHLARIVQKNLGHQIKRLPIQKALAEQRRTHKLVTDVNFEAIWKAIDLT